MEKTMIIQGRTITYKDIEWIRQLMKSNPTWHRTRLSKEICLAWDWVTDNGKTSPAVPFCANWKKGAISHFRNGNAWHGAAIRKDPNLWWIMTSRKFQMHYLKFHRYVYFRLKKRVTSVCLATCSTNIIIWAITHQ